MLRQLQDGYRKRAAKECTHVPPLSSSAVLVNLKTSTVCELYTLLRRCVHERITVCETAC